MAGIKPVEYKNDSIVNGFAIAGDEKEINQTNAKNIDKDNDAGNLQPLDDKQETSLKNYVENDSTNYESTEGENLEEPDQNSDENGTNKGVAVAATTTSTAALAFGTALLANTGKLSGLMNSFTAPVVGGIDLAIAGASLATVLTFDSDFSKRISEASNASNQINQINQYLASINEDIEALSDDSVDYSELGIEDLLADKQENESEKMTAFDVLSSLYKQLEAAKKEGNQEKINEISSQIQKFESTVLSKLEGNSEEEATSEETTGDIAEGEQKEEKVDSLVSRLNTNNSNAHSISEESTSISEFLKEGKTFGTIGVVNSVALAGCAAVSAMLATKAFIGVNLFTIGNAIAGAAMCGAAAGLFAGSSLTMAVKASQELNASSKGQDIQSSINQMKPQLANHDKILETISKNQEENQNGSGENTNTPITSTNSPSSSTPTPSPNSGNGGGNSTSSPSSGSSGSSGSTPTV